MVLIDCHFGVFSLEIEHHAPGGLASIFYILHLSNNLCISNAIEPLESALNFTKSISKTRVRFFKTEKCSYGIWNASSTPTIVTCTKAATPKKATTKMNFIVLILFLRFISFESYFLLYSLKIKWNETDDYHWMGPGLYTIFFSRSMAQIVHAPWQITNAVC